MTDVNLRDCGATGNGVDDDSGAWRAAMVMLRSGGRLYVPPGAYRMPPTNGPWCCDVTADGVEVLGVPGASALLSDPPLARQVPLVRANNRADVSFTGITFDGGWAGDAGPQADPKSHGLALRGCVGARVRDCRFVRNYGDCVWIGHGADPDNRPSRDVVLEGCTGVGSARNGATIGGPAFGVYVLRGSFTDVRAGAFDMEGGAVEGIHLTAVTLSGRGVALSIDSGSAEYARHVRVADCTVDGVTLVQRANDVQILGSRLRTLGGGTSWAPVFVRFAADDVLVERCVIEDNCRGPGPGTHDGAVSVRFYAAGESIARPKRVIVRDNVVRCTGLAAVHVNGADGPVVVEGNAFYGGYAAMGPVQAADRVRFTNNSTM